MAGIASPGIGSGLDINGLVTKLVAAEGQAASTRLNRQEAQLQAKLSAYGTFKGTLSEFQSALSSLKSLSSFQVRTAVSSNTAVFTATASSAAVQGTHSITVTKLAQGQKLASSAFGDTTAAVGTGTLTFQFGTASDEGFTPNVAKAAQTVTIEAAHSTLQGIRDAVNSAKIGVTASIVNDGTGNRLVFSANDTGAANSLKVTVAETEDSPGLSRLAYDPDGVKNLSETMAALDAELTVDGLPIKSASNTLTGAIEGVTLSLLSAPATGSPGTLTVAQDKGSVTGAVNTFIAKYNALIDQIGKLSSYDTETKKGGVLLGDATLRGVTSQLRRVLSEAVQGLTGPYASLADIGITTQSDGKLKLDSSKLQTALDTNFDAVGRLFAVSGRTTDPLIKYVSATAKTQPGSYAVDITRLAPGEDVAGTIGGAAGIGSGSTLTGTGNAEGLAIEVQGGNTGLRGSVEFSRGVADRLDALLSDLLDSDGSIASATQGLNDRVKDIGKQREALSARLERVEARYRAQFTALDTLLGRMRVTSDYLSRQLAALPKITQGEN